MKTLIIAFVMLFGQRLFMVKSTDFADGNGIPFKFTCDGQNLSPALVIENPPKKTKSFALIMDDTESPNGEFVHWVVWNIPVETKKIEENKPVGIQGRNTIGQNKYFGPCPPNGLHTYNFKLYALNTVLEIPKESGKMELLNAMQGHITGAAVVRGTYKRQ